MTAAMDEDALHAAVDLAGRAGAREFEIGYLHDDVPADQAAWWAHAQLRGARITVENHQGPAQAAEALAQKLLAGGKCTHCEGLITLTAQGAVAFPGHLSDGSQMTEERARSMRQCQWHRDGPRWVRGCTPTHPETPPTGPAAATGPNRAARRRAARKDRHR